jgi:hypothetical protein
MAQRRLSIQAAQQEVRMANQRARIESLTNENSSRRLGMRVQELSILGRQERIQGNINGIMGKAQAIDTQRVANANKIWDLTFRQQQAAQRLATFTEKTKISQTATGQFFAGGKTLAADSATVMTYERLQHEVELYERLLVEAEMRTKGLDFQEQALNATSAELAGSLKVLEAQYEKLIAVEGEQSAAALRVAEEMKVTELQAKMTAVAIEELDAVIDSQSTVAVENLAGSLRHLGRTLVITGGVALAIFGAMAASAAKSSKEMTLAATQARPAGAGAGATRAISGHLFDTVLSQMQRFPATSQEMADSLYQIFSGTNVQNIGKATEMLKTFNQMAVAGGTDLKTMTDAGISIYNNFPGQFKNMTQAANRFFAAVRFGRMNADQFAKSLSFILPIAKEAGMTFDDVGAAMAFLTRQTGARRTTQDAQGLARLIQLLARPEVQAGLKGRGVDVIAGGKMRPILDIMTDIHDKIHMTNVEWLNFFKTMSATNTSKGLQGTQQAIRVFAQYQQNIKGAIDVNKQLRRDNDELVKSFAAMSRDPGVRWQVFQNQMRALALTVGRDLIPVFARVGYVVAVAAKAFMAIPHPIRTIIIDFTALLAIATVIIGILASMAGVLVATKFAWTEWASAFKIGRDALAALARAGGNLKVFEKLAVDVGEANTKMRILLATIAVLIAVLPIVATHFGGIFHALGGIKTMATAVNIVFNLLIARWIAGSLIMMGLRTSMLYTVAAMALWEAVVITIGALLVQHFIRKIPYVEKAMRGLGGAVYDLFHSDPKPLVSHVQMQKDIKDVTDLYNALKKQKEEEAKRPAKFMEPRLKDLRATIKAAFPKMDEHELDVFITHAQRRWEQKVAAAKFKPLGLKMDLSGSLTYTDAQFIKELQRVSRLNAAIERAPNMRARLRAIEKYNTAVKNMSQYETAGQKAAQDQLLQTMEKTSAFTDAQAGRIATRMRRLQQQFAIRPTLGLSRSIEHLQAQFDKLSPAQQAYFQKIQENMGIPQGVAENTFSQLHRLQQEFKVRPTMGLATEIQHLQTVMQAASPAQQAYFQALEANMGISNALASRTFTQLRRLQAQFRVAPTMGLATQIQRLQTIMQSGTQAQQAYFQQLETNLGDAKVASDRTVLAMARNVNRLRTAFEAAPSVRTYQAWYAANKRFTTLATQDQQQFAQDTIAANKAATDKIKENFDSVLSKVRSMYDSIKSANVAAFGQLGSGPVVTQLNAQAQKIRDAASTQAGALRDEAKKIQDAAENAQSEVSATMGNLIDWGLVTTGADNKAATDRQIKALNDQADNIEKAAGIRADKLEKRISEHRLTPKEIQADLQAQVKAFTNWNKHLNQLQKRGAPPELISQLRALGPEYDNMLKGVLRMTPAQFKRYVNTFKRGQKAIEQQSIKELQQQLKQYRRFGRNIAKAIAAGVEDENAALRRAFVKLIKQAFPGLQIPGGRVPRRAAPRRAAHRPTRGAVHYHYHADKGHQLTPEAYFRKMHFRHRNQRRC